MFEHDIFSPPDTGGPLGALATGDGPRPWQPQLVPEVSGGQLFQPVAIPSVTTTGGFNQPFAPQPLPLAQTSTTTRLIAPARVPVVPVLPLPRGGTTRPLSFLPGTPPAGGALIPIPGQAPTPDGAQPAAPASSLPSWVLPVALIGGGLIIGALVLASSKKKATPNSRGWSRTEREAKGRKRRARRRHGRRRRSVLSALHNPRKRNKGKPRIVSGHPASRRCPHCGGAHSRSAHWSHMRGHHRKGPKGGTYYGHVR